MMVNEEYISTFFTTTIPWRKKPFSDDPWPISQADMVKITCTHSNTSIHNYTANCTYILLNRKKKYYCI